MCQVHGHQWRRLLIRSEVCLADDVENNRVEDTDAVDRVRVLGDRIDDLSSLVLFEASVVNPKISQVLQALSARHSVMVDDAEPKRRQRRC